MAAVYCWPFVVYAPQLYRGSRAAPDALCVGRVAHCRLYRPFPLPDNGDDSTGEFFENRRPAGARRRRRLAVRSTLRRRELARVGHIIPACVEQVPLSSTSRPTPVVVVVVVVTPVGASFSTGDIRVGEEGVLASDHFSIVVPWIAPSCSSA